MKNFQSGKNKLVDKLNLYIAYSPEALLIECRNELIRLLSGDFTEEEFQNLCHKFDESDKCGFKKGCEEYQKKLFGE